MGTTLTALTTSAGTGFRLAYVVAIEGYPYLLSTADDADGAPDAWAATDWQQQVGHLKIQWNQSQRVHPWEPFSSNGSSVTLLVQDIADDASPFGVDVFNREGGVSTRATLDHTPSVATVTVQATGAFASSGTAYIGPETFTYSGVTATTFTGCTRGMYSPFATEGADRFSRYHRATSTLEGPDPLSVPATQVRDRPTTWKGRWVAIYVHRIDGTAWDVKSQAHLVFAGTISSVADTADGRTAIVVDDVRRKIVETVVMREQWRAKIRPLIDLKLGMYFDAMNVRDVGGTVDAGAANRLVVVAASGSVNEITAGRYSYGDLQAKINDWLASEKAAARLLFRQNFVVNGMAPDGSPRSAYGCSDTNTTTVNATRTARIWTSHNSIRRFLGWTDDIGGDFPGGEYYTTFYSGTEPKFVPFALGEPAVFGYEAARGSFVSQGALLSPDLALNVPGIFSAVGVLRIGSDVFMCEAPSGGEITLYYTRKAALAVGVEPNPDWNQFTIGQGAEVEMAQTLVLQETFKNLVLTLLASTGEADFNWTTYDALPESCAAAIPYELISSLADDLAACPGSDDVMTVIVDKPTRLGDLFNASFILRRGVNFIWRQGKIRLKAISTPTSSAALTVSQATKFVPIGSKDSQRAVSEETDELMRNVLTIKHNGSPLSGEYRDTTTLVDAASAGAHGSRAATLTARNAVRGAGAGAEDIVALLPGMASLMALLGRPLLRTTVPIGITEFETHTAGETVLFTDPFFRDPQTGARGISARPGFILSDWHDWAACVGEITIILFPGLTIAPYSPCAQVDDTAANAGYDVGTKTLTCYAHKHSPAGAAADATYFPATSKVRIVEIDPDDPAAPLTWDDTVASQSGNTITLTTGLAGWDTALLYRVYSDDYGDATTAQRANCYQADNADGQVVDSRAPYALAHFGAGQTGSFTVSAATDLPARPPDIAFGDGKALDTGHAYDTAIGINNLISYKTAMQAPESVVERIFGGGGTWQLVYCAPVFLGIGQSTVARTRKLYVSPTIMKAGAASGDIRVTLATSPPTSADPANPSRDDVTRHQPYSEHTFTTTSANYENQTAVALDTEHLQLAPGLLGGVGWLYVELATAARFRGFGLIHAGPVVVP